MKGEKVYQALYGRGPDRRAGIRAGKTEDAMSEKKKRALSAGLDPVAGTAPVYWSEEAHGWKMIGRIVERFKDKKGATRYRFAIADGATVVLPDHYNLRQKLDAIPADDYEREELELVFCGRTLENEKGDPVKDQSGKQMYEWLVGLKPVDE